MTALQSLVVAYSLIWVVLGGYFFRLGGQVGRLRKEVERLEDLSTR